MTEGGAKRLEYEAWPLKVNNCILGAIGRIGVRIIMGFYIINGSYVNILPLKS